MDPNKMTIEFYHLTSTGCKWLEKIVQVNSKREAGDAAADYVMNTFVQAKQLLDGWHKNGEDVTMYPNFDILEIEYDRSGATFEIANSLDDAE